MDQFYSVYNMHQPYVNQRTKTDKTKNGCIDRLRYLIMMTSIIIFLNQNRICRTWMMIKATMTLNKICVKSNYENIKIKIKSDQFGSALKRVSGINEVKTKLSNKIESMLVTMFLNGHINNKRRGWRSLPHLCIK